MQDLFDNYNQIPVEFAWSTREGACGGALFELESPGVDQKEQKE